MAFVCPVHILVHIVWSTWDRLPLIPADRDAELGAYLGAKARELRCVLLACGSADDHVHVVASLHSTVAVATLAQRLKGASAHDLSRRGWPHALRWQAGYWARSVGESDVDDLLPYVSRQRSHHDTSSPAEAWMRVRTE